MFRLVVVSLITISVLAEDYRIVSLDEGDVKGVKYWGGDYYEFYGIPYATVPKGRDRFKRPLPPKPWNGTIEANSKDIVCPQIYYTGDEDEVIIIGQEECLAINLFVPKVATKENLRPVLVYIHSGAFAIGNGNMASYRYLARHDVIVVSFNYRLGAIGFACLDTEDIPGNAGMKDQVAALKWIKKNVAEFGGDPNRVTVAGFSVGAGMAELLALSKTTEGLIHKVILESGSALNHWAINNEPIETALNIAKSLGYNGTSALEDLTEFYLSSTVDKLASKSLNFFLKNGTFGFAPCIEKVSILCDTEPFLTESPLDILKKGLNNPVAVITGFSNMEGLSRANHFEVYSEAMNDDFSDFLPTDLHFPDEKTKNEFLKDVQRFYFNDEDVSPETLKAYIDYNSDFMFKYAIVKSAKLHAEKAMRPVYLYEFSHVGKLSTKHIFMDLISGASHRDQTSYILDFFGWTSNEDDLNTRDRLTLMWADFVEHEDPTFFESALIDFRWPPYKNKDNQYLHINSTVAVRRDLFEKSFQFWDEVYEKYYLNPTAPTVNKAKIKNSCSD